MKNFGWMDFIFKGQGQVKRDAEKQEAKGDERWKMKGNAQDAKEVKKRISM